MKSIVQEIGCSENGLRAAIKNNKPFHNHYWSIKDTINLNEFVSPHKYKVTKSNNNYYFDNLNNLCLFLGISTYIYYKYLNNKNNIIKGYTIYSIN